MTWPDALGQFLFCHYSVLLYLSFKNCSTYLAHLSTWPSSHLSLELYKTFPDMETVFVIGATGNIGVAAIKGTLASGRNVLAAVRNQASADKMFQHVGTTEGLTTVEVDVSSETGIKNVVTQVEAGKLPAFQHVISAG